MVSILLTANIIPENEDSETARDSIIEAIEHKGQLLSRWSDMHASLYNNNHDIPLAKALTPTKLANHDVITTDTCNGARITARLLMEAIKNKCKEKGTNTDAIKLYFLGCHNHLRNVWIGKMNKDLSKFLTEVLREDLDSIDSRWRVTTNFALILIAIDKEFSLCCNYKKGDGETFFAWMHTYHPGAFLFPVERGLGSQQDFTVDGAGAVYMNRQYYMDFLDKSIGAEISSNILHHNLFTVLQSVEMIAMTRVYAIFHVAICLPHRFLVGKGHKLGKQDWSCRSANKLIVKLDNKLKQIVESPEKFLDHDFMMNIYEEERSQMTLFDDYWLYVFENKQSPSIDKDSKFIQLDQLVAKLFFSEEEEIKETDDLVIQMGEVAAKCWRNEFRDPKKATCDNFSGTRSWADTTEEEHNNLLVTFATNDMAEQPFGILTYQVDRCNGILFASNLIVFRFCFIFSIILSFLLSMLVLNSNFFSIKVIIHSCLGCSCCIPK